MRQVEVVSGDPGPVEPLEQERLARDPNLGPEIRLSCQIRVQSDLDVKVLMLPSVTGVPAGTRPMD